MVPFATGGPGAPGASLTNITGGTPGTVALLGFGSSDPAFFAATPTSSITLTAVGGVTIANYAFMASRDGVVTSISAFFNFDALVTLGIAGVVTVRAELWISPNTASPLDPNNTFIPTGVAANISFVAPTPAFVILPGTFGSSTSLANFPVAAGSRLLMVFSVSAPVGVLPLATTVTGSASAGIAVQ